MSLKVKAINIGDNYYNITLSHRTFMGIKAANNILTDKELSTSILNLINNGFKGTIRLVITEVSVTKELLTMEFLNVGLRDLVVTDIYSNDKTLVPDKGPLSLRGDNISLAVKQYVSNITSLKDK